MAFDAEAVVALFGTIVNDFFSEEVEMFELHRDDILKHLRSGSQSRISFRHGPKGTHEFGFEEATAIVNFVGVVVGTYSLLKDKKLPSAADTLVVTIWKERLMTAGIPEGLAEKMARKYASQLADILAKGG